MRARHFALAAGLILIGSFPSHAAGARAPGRNSMETGQQAQAFVKVCYLIRTSLRVACRLAVSRR